MAPTAATTENCHQTSEAVKCVINLTRICISVSISRAPTPIVPGKICVPNFENSNRLQFYNGNLENKCSQISVRGADNGIMLSSQLDGMKCSEIKIPFYLITTFCHPLFDDAGSGQGWPKKSRLAAFLRITFP